MLSLPVTLVGLQMIMLRADLTHMSTSFFIAMISSWIAVFVANKMQSCSRPATLITSGLLIGLVSSFFLIDYSSANTTEEKREYLR